MANEGSTKPTYSANWMVEEKDPLLWELRYIADSPAQEHGGFHPRVVKAAQDALAELLRVRGLLQRLEWAGSDGDGFPMCPVCEVEGGVPTDPHEPDCWLAKELSPNFPQSSSQGAESADIGKLDTADKSGVEMGKVNRVESTNCTTCGKQILTASTAVASGMMPRLHEYFCTCTRLVGSAETGGEKADD